MDKNLVKTNTSYLKKGKRSIGILIICVLALTLAVSAIFILPRFADVKPHEAPFVTAIVPQKDGIVGVGATPEKIFVTIKYSDGTEETKSLAELTVVGLDTTKVNDKLENVVLDFGGFKQSVTYNVAPTTLELNYIPSTGGKIEGPTKQRVFAGEDASTVTAVPDYGYRFLGWNDGVMSPTRTDTKVSANKDIRARFSKIEYLVIFYYPDGTNGREILVPFDTAVTLMPDPSEHQMQKYGYRFVGWDISQEELKSVKSDLFITPIYEKYAADVDFEFTLGIEGLPLGTSADLKEYYPKEEKSTISVSANPDRIFVGWQVLSNNGEWIKINPENPEFRIEVNGTNNLVMFGSEREGVSDTYKLSFTPTANTEKIKIKADFVYKTSVVTFTSMSLAAHAPIEIPVGQSLGNYFNVPSEQDSALFNAVSLPHTIGYTFKGWYVRNSKLDTNGLPVLIKNDHSFNRPTDLIAYWEKDKYDVIFRKGDSDNIANDIVLNIYYQDTLAGEGENKFPDILPTKANHTFVGWYLMDNGVVTNRIIDKTYQVERELTEIYPVFTVNKKDLTVSIEGSGAIKIREQGGSSAGFAGVYKMDVTKNYILEFTAHSGYTLVSIEVTTSSGKTEDFLNTNYHEKTINGIINSNYHIKAIFKLAEYELRITNGSDENTDSGTVSYQTLVDNDLITEYSNNVTILTSIIDGLSKHIWVDARDGYYISSIKVNDEFVPNIPSMTNSYTLVLENINRRFNIEIVYGEFLFNTEINYINNWGRITAKDTAPYRVSDQPSFDVQASEGYFIKTLKLNGTAINPEIKSSNYLVENIMLMGYSSQSSASDERITGYLLTLRNLSSDVKIEVEFARLYYNISVVLQGFGSVDIENAVVNYGDEITILSQTGGNFYVASYSVNGTLIDSYTEHNSEQSITLKSIKEDKTLKIEFRRRTYALTFEGSNATVGIATDGKTSTYELPKTVVLEAASNEYFVIQAKEGYKLTSITVNGKGEDVAFNALSHTVRLDNISGDHNIQIECSSITYTIKHYLANGGGSTTQTNDDRVTHNGIYKLTIDLANGKYLDIDAIKIIGVLSQQVPTNIADYIIDLEDTVFEGQFILSINGFIEDIEVFIPVKDMPSGGGSHFHSMSLTYDASMGTLAAIKPINQNLDEIANGTDVTIRFLPLSDEFVLKYLVINGEHKELEFGQTEYTIEFIEEDIAVHAVYDRRLFNLSISHNDNGVVTAETAIFNYMDDITLRIVADIGYEVSYFAIGEKDAEPTPLPKEILQAINNGQINYVIGGQYTAGDLRVDVRFAPKTFNLSININEGGSVNQDTDSNLAVNYGDYFTLGITALANHFISEIYVNDVSINPATLENLVMNGDIQRYTSGMLNLDIINNTNIRVVFSPNIYRVSLSSSLNGTTLVSTDNSNTKPSDGKNLVLYAGDNVNIRMTAMTGYHIQSLEINGQIIDGWQLDNEEPNNNRNIDYKVVNITGNLNVRVVYAINEYKVTYTISNGSVNFARYDTEYSQYGALTLFGYFTSAPSTYDGISHGSDLRFVFSPVRSKGYYVSLFTISWVDPENRETTQSTVLDYTAEAHRSGQYVYENIRGNLHITLEYKRELFDYSGGIITDQRGTQFPSNGTLIHVFSNPYTSTTGTDVQLVDGKYEYGLRYEALINPGVGYELTAFEINGIDRRSSVRNNRFQGEIRSDIAMFATYTIASYEIMLSGNAGGDLGIYDESGNQLWRKGATNNHEIIYTQSGRVEIYADYIIASYNTNLTFRITPQNEQNGYNNGFMISSIYINNSRHVFNDGDIDLHLPLSVTSKITMSATFALHQYTVELAYNEHGGVSSATPSLVTWGKDATIRISIYDGYLLSGVELNGNLNSDIYNAIKNYRDTSFVISDIRENLVVKFIYERKPFDIQFRGGYGDTFNVNGEDKSAVTGVSINDNQSAHFSALIPNNSLTDGANLIATSGIVAGGGTLGARYKDKLAFYFIPVNGYRISSINITMKDLYENDITVLVRAEELYIYESGEGFYYIVENMTGNISVTVNYVIKNYAVNMTIIGNGRDVKNYATNVEHHAFMELDFIADYGYHLQSLTINNRTIITDYRRESDSGLLVYKYTTSYGQTRLNINDELINNRESINITARFEINSFDVRMFVNGQDIAGDSPDTTLQLELANHSITYGTVARIAQNRSEGYSITSIRVQDKQTSPNVSYDFAYWEGGNNLSAANLFFTVSGQVIDMLDYHSITNKVLYVHYTTEIDKHYSVINSYTYETGIDTGAVPTMNGVPAFTLSTTYSDNKEGNATKHEYFVRASFTLNIASVANNDYQFAGYQEYDASTGKWTYVENGKNGITISSEGRVLSYVIKGDRTFRAVVFRLYKVTIQIHPEYKYLSGSYSSDRFEMRYRRYANLTATAVYEENQKPNISGDTVILNDTDGNASDGTYTYRIQYGAKLILRGTDSFTTTNPTRSINYYYIKYNELGMLQQEAVPLASGAVIGENKLVHAYFDNNLLLSFSLETEGAISGNEGGTVKYFVQNTQQSLMNNSLRVSANARVRVEITPNANYRYESILEREALNEVDESGNRRFSDNWNRVYTTADGTIVVTETIDPVTGRVTKVTMELIATENTIYKIKFWKLIEVTSRVELFTDETTNQDIIDFYTPQFISASPNGTYNYNDEISFSLPVSSENNTWNLRYQFVGYFVNGVNTFKTLNNSFPSEALYSATYRLNDDNQSSGVSIETVGGKFVVDIVARYVPIYNITVENEYLFEQDGHSRYFDVGQITYSVMGYTMDRAQYYQSTVSVLTKTDSEMRTDKSIQALGKINDVRDGSKDLANAPYNIWSNNTMTLNWASSSMAIGESYNFIAWQYYIMQNGEWKWVNIPFTDSDPSNKVTLKTFTFPISVLLNASYFIDTANSNNDYQYAASRYTTSGDFDGTMDIRTIRIRPLFQRMETAGIERVVYYEREGIHNEEHKGDNPAKITETGNISGRFNYYQVITMDPAKRTGYDFLGWYELVDNEFVKITHTGGFDANNNRYLASDGIQLKVRVVDSKLYYARYIKVWDIIVQTVNLSGQSSYLMNSVPYLTYYGSPVGDEYPTDPLPEPPSRMMVFSMYAGASVKFMLSTAGTLYDANYDRYHNTLDLSTNTWTGLDAIYSALPKGNSVSQIEEAYFIITANSAKTIEIQFRSYGELVVENIYYNSYLRLPQNLANAIGLGDTPYIKDGSSNDHDNSTNAKITIKNIPIVSGARYDGVFGNILTGMTINNYITSNSISSFGINFNGDELHSTNYPKRQVFKFYNTSAGGSDGLTKMDVPFHNGYNSSAGDGTSGNPYLINTLSHLRFIDSMYIGNGYTLSGIHFKVTSNILLYSDSNRLTVGLCADGSGFDGYFDGSNFQLHGLRLSTSANTGLFAKTFGADIRNIQIGGVNVSVSGTENVGYLIGYAYGTNIQNIKPIASDGSQKQISGTKNVGGIVGYATQNSTIQNSDIQNFMVRGAESIGGILGRLGKDSRVDNVFANTPYITATSNGGGGVIGYTESYAGASNTYISLNNARANLPNFNDTSNGKHIGGLVGINGTGNTIRSSYVYGGNLIIISTFSITFVDGDQNNAHVNAGAGGLVGYNQSGATIEDSYLSGSGEIAATATIFGGIAGVNFGTIRNSDTGSYRMYTNRTQMRGGMYGMHVGYNNGTIQGANTNIAGNNNFNNTNTAYFITYNGSTDFGTGGNRDSYGNDSSFIYIGGISGYNGSSGVIETSSFRGKLIINRRAGNGAHNKLYMGGITGFNNSGSNNVRNNTVTSSAILAHINIWADVTTSPVSQHQYLGRTTGNNQQGSSGGSSNHLAVMVVGNGVYRTERPSTKILGILTYTGHAGNFREVRAYAQITDSSASTTSITYQTTRSIPSDLYTQNSTWGYKDYDGYLRRVQIGT